MSFISQQPTSSIILFINRIDLGILFSQNNRSSIFSSLWPFSLCFLKILPFFTWKTYSILVGYGNGPISNTTRRFRTRNVNWTPFCAMIKSKLNPLYCHIDNMGNEIELERLVDRLHLAIGETCNKTLTKLKHKSFNEDLQCQQTNVNRIQRRFQRQAEPEIREKLQQTYIYFKIQYKKYSKFYR